MRIRELALATFVAAVLSCGCSQQPESQGDGTPPVAQSQGSSASSEAVSGEPASPGAANSRHRIVGRSAESAALAPVQTAMVLDPEMDRLRQNGPTRVQRQNRRYRMEVPVAPVVPSSDGNGAPVFAEEIETLDVDVSGASVNG